MGKRKTPEERRLEDEEDRWIAAAAIAISAGVLRPCAEHPRILLLVEGADIRDAYKCGDRAFQKAPRTMTKFFNSRRHMQEWVRSLVVESQRKHCPICKPAPSH